MTIWSKFVCGKANKKHSGGNSQDVDVEEVTVIPVIPAPIDRHHLLILQPSSHRQHLQVTKKQNQRQNRMILEKR